MTIEKPYKRAEKLIRKMKKQKHVPKVHAQMAISAITDGMKKTMPKHIVRKGVIINLHEMLA